MTHSHGYFTPSGHVVAIAGYNEQGFIVNDPYGELMYNPPHSYYNTYANGRGLTYSYNLIQQTCVTGQEFWVHFISR
ncbi:MAG: C39 family peptidase [Leptolyngbyaceae cyanobacterium]